MGTNEIPDVLLELSLEVFVLVCQARGFVNHRELEYSKGER